VINITKAESTSDLDGIIRLIYETDDYIYPSMCNSDYELFEIIMKKLLFGDTIFSYKNIIIACENYKTIGLLLYIDKNSKLPETIENIIGVNKKQSTDFDNVMEEYFKPLLSKINDDYLYINNLCVNIEKRRCGIAGKLINHLLQTFTNKKIVLDCLEENTAAIEFYLKWGFKITDRFLGFAGNKQEPISCLKLEVIP